MGIIISLSGFDGLGKSTQVNLLSKYLKDQGKKVLVTEMMFSYFLLKPFIKFFRSTTGSLPSGPVRRNSNVFLKLWFIPAFLDIWMMYLFKVIPLKGKYDVILADRFYPDIWANLLYYGYITEWAFKFFVKFLPKANVAFMLSAKESVVIKREQEFPLAYYSNQAKIYKEMSTLVKYIIIDADQSPASVALAIKKALNAEIEF